MASNPSPVDKTGARNPITLLLVYTQSLERAGLISLINHEAEFRVIGEISEPKEAAALVQNLQPDVILMELPIKSDKTIESIRIITNDNPWARILAIAEKDSDHSISSAIKAGVLGCILKDSSSAEFFQAICEVSQNKTPLSSGIVRKLASESNNSSDTLIQNKYRLTLQEQKVLQEIAEGLSNGNIAEVLGISQRTVEVHVRNILKKLNLVNRTQAAVFATREGIIKEIR